MNEKKIDSKTIDRNEEQEIKSYHIESLDALIYRQNFCGESATFGRLAQHTNLRLDPSHVAVLAICANDPFRPALIRPIWFERCDAQNPVRQLFSRTFQRNQNDIKMSSNARQDFDPKT